MSLIIGNNCGFCLIEPTDDPSAGLATLSNRARACKFTAPEGATAINSMGWWVDNITGDVMFQLGIYDHDAENNRPGNLLASTGDISKGTETGWKRGSISCSITPGVIYWLAVQCDSPGTSTRMNVENIGGEKSDYINATELPNTWGVSTGTNTYRSAVYAVYTTGTGCKINISDSWKEISAMKINIDNTWKDVSSMKIKIGNVWKDVF